MAIRGPTTDQNGGGRSDNMFLLYYPFASKNSWAKLGWEYPHWIDPGVGIHLEVIIPENGRAQV